jgi:uncharacterized membrane protein YphA (DoxX/SURF4 family)
MASIHNIAFLVGRVIAAGFFLMNSFNHFAQLNMMTGYAKSKGVPAPALAVGGSGVLLFLGGLSLLLGFHPTIGAGLLVIFLLGVSFGIHNFWTVQDQQAKQGEMINFLKNMAILRSAVNDLGHPAAVADESRSLILDNCRSIAITLRTLLCSVVV